MAAEFLAENNVCGQTILQIVAEGNTIICELLRLKEFIPEVFCLKTKEEQQKYGEIIMDFSYFQISDAQEARIEADEKLQVLDEEIRENYLVILNRFYIVFESIHKYIKELNTFLDELNGGMFIQQSMEKVFQDEEGKQLMCEALYLYGVMLLVVDLQIPGLVRERLLVAYNRYSALKTDGDSNIDEVCKLLRSTGYNDGSTSSSALSSFAAAKKTQNYPEDYFGRVPVNPVYVEMVIGRLRSDDVYNQISVYPLPEHRSTALANQAGMLYVCLFFATNMLHNQASRMREIVDKFFSDNWIVSLYMGITVNLLNAWDPFKAAKSAMLNTFDSGNLKEICSKQKRSMETLLNRTRSILKEGNLTEQKLLDNIPKVTALIRECNITVRWVMLHTGQPVIDVGSAASLKKCRQVKELIESDIDFKGIEFFELLLNTAQLEVKIREILKRLLDERQERWDSFKKEACERIQDLADAYSGDKPFGKMKKNDSLSKWFLNIGREITKLSNEDKELSVSGRNIIQLIQALEEVQDFHDLSKNMQVKQNMVETRQYLQQMFHTISIKEDDLINLQLIGDFSYAWRLIDSYTPMMQENIKKQPSLVIKLRSTFLKLASALEIPLLRLNQAESEDLMDVSKYYSNELANFVRKVVQIIPETMFTILAQIIDLQTNVIKQIPMRLEKEKLKEYAQLDERFTIAKLTYSVSTFTEGILAMKTTLVGVVALDPKQLLEDGIRKEFVKNVSDAFHTNLTFNAKAKESELEAKLTALHKIIDGYKRSFEYVQDYLNIHCLRIWNEEMQRIINYNVQRECNPFVKSKILDWESEFQSSTIPIPSYEPLDMASVTFVGRLAREIMRITDPKTTIYVDICTTWYDPKSHKPLLTNKFAARVNETFGPPGLVGLDKLYSFLVTAELENFLVTIARKLQHEPSWYDALDNVESELQKVDYVELPGKTYANLTTTFTRIWPQLQDWILKIGQKQILRTHVAFELNCSCKLKSTKLESSLRALNDAILMDVKRHTLNESKPLPSADLVFELNRYLECAGLYNPYRKKYIETKSPRFLSLLVFLFVIVHLPRFQYMKNVDSLIAKKKNDPIDGFPVVVGLLTVFRQFHNAHMDTFLVYICQYVMSFVDANLKAKQEICAEAVLALRFLEIFTRVAEIPRAQLEQYIPDNVLNQYEFLSGGKS
ncbi:WASH complex subunit 5 [Culex quinquefasciatus]|uniref:WASH complex subunit 5 n=1 Tax=Culex quinquefasciatus TaxID=7176 RepID=UPI0018E367CC|nr:WASH complex subunit 5 [Culex quinquefasciatus]